MLKRNYLSKLFSHPASAAIIVILLIGLVAFIVDYVKNKNYKETVFYKTGKVLDIKRDDDGEYHLLVILKNNQVISLNNVKCNLYYTNNKNIAILPYVKIRNTTYRKIESAWGYNSSKNGKNFFKPVKVYLPKNYKIPLIVD